MDVVQALVVPEVQADLIVEVGREDTGLHLVMRAQWHGKPHPVAETTLAG